MAVRQFELRDGVTTCLYASPSFQTVLGHDPDALLGDQSALSPRRIRLHSPEAVSICQSPTFVADFEVGRLSDGYVEEVRLSVGRTRLTSLN